MGPGKTLLYRNYSMCEIYCTKTQILWKNWEKPGWSKEYIVLSIMRIPVSKTALEQGLHYGETIIYEDSLYSLLYYVLARFIWNAEISVSVAIHCYERLF